jgi:UDP-N-acetylglucosamine 1-carboxyvinyltransferase
MDKILIKGGRKLNGKIQISGSKNAALPLMASSLLTEDTLTLSNMPCLADIITMNNLLAQHGVDVNNNGCADGKLHDVIKLNASKIINKTAPYDIVRKMRASVLVLGPLLARFGEAIVSLPGGCAIGTRPIDLHLMALREMGAEIELKDGYIHAWSKGKLQGAKINFEKISVGATENVLMAATLAEGVTILNNAALEPEVTDLANCLIKMGAKIKGIGTNTLEIEGVKELHGANYSVIADRIEAGTYAVAAAIAGGEVELVNITPELIDNVTDKLAATGATIVPTSDGIKITRQDKDIKPVDIDTQPYPGFPTDMQAQFMALMTIADGASTINENIFENRFMHAPEINRMGANINVSGNTAVVKGVKNLYGAEVMATDLRASVSLVLAGLAAEGETTINRVYHIDRGYERIEEKLSACGAEIKRVS